MASVEVSRNNYDPGDTVLLRAVFRDSTGALADPTTVTFKVRDASGSTQSYTYGAAQITRESLGVFTKAVTFADSNAADGTWRWRAIGTGTVATAESMDIPVRDSWI